MLPHAHPSRPDGVPERQIVFLDPDTGIGGCESATNMSIWSRFLRRDAHGRRALDVPARPSVQPGDWINHRAAGRSRSEVATCSEAEACFLSITKQKMAPFPSLPRLRNPPLSKTLPNSAWDRYAGPRQDAVRRRGGRAPLPLLFRYLARAAAIGACPWGGICASAIVSPGRFCRAVRAVAAAGG